MSAKKYFFILSLIILISSICGTAEARLLYAGGSEPGVVYQNVGGSSWKEISEDLGDAVLCLCEYNGCLYAGTTTDTPGALSFQSGLWDGSLVSKKELILSRALGGTSSEKGRVWRYDGGTEWTQVGGDLDNQICSLIAFRGNLYAGTAYESGRLYRYIDVNDSWQNIVDFNSWDGFRSMYDWEEKDLLYIGDILHDKIGHYDGNSFTEVIDLEGSCIWDFDMYDSNLYASAYQSRVHRSPDGTTWTTIRDYQECHSWELETFQDYLYVTSGPKLERYDGNEFSPVWTVPDGNEIISMISTGDTLILGTGKEAGSAFGVSGVGRVYTYNGSGVPQLISGDMGSGIQSLYALEIPWVDLSKVDDVNDGNCVLRDYKVTYTIYYSYPNEPNTIDINDVKIIDYLPDEVEPNNPSDPNYNLDGSSYTWWIGTVSPGDSNYVTLTVVVKYPGAGGIIRNKCEIRSGDELLNIAYEYTQVCCWNGPVIYVDADADGLNYGTSWEDAYNYLQDALLAARNCGCNEVRVAAGTYKPDVSSLDPDGTGDREAAFKLINGVEIKGDYAGFGESDPNARDYKKYETILSGDLKGNDGEAVNPCASCRAENSYHVVTASYTNATAVLDGFTITAGNADGSYPCDVGGGMYNDGGSPMVRSCTFKYNSALGEDRGCSSCVGGAGVYNYGGGDIRIVNCLFSNNWAERCGGGICSDTAADANVINCTFVANGVRGGIYAVDNDCNTTVTNCILWGNGDVQIFGDQVNVTYSDIQGGWDGQDNIDEDPIFKPDGYHLMPCSPCIDSGTNAPPGGLSLPDKDIDGDSRVMDSDCIDGAIVDMGVDEYYFEDCNDLGRACCPIPEDGQVGITMETNLSWTEGCWVAEVSGHDVYFGTNFDEVNEASAIVYQGAVTDPCYPLTNLNLNTTYYWRIDEVNEPYIWRGPVWSLTITDYISIDDFEDYLYSDPEGDAACPYYDPNDMRWVWLDGHVQKNPQGDCGGDLEDYNPLAIEGSMSRLPGSRIIRTDEGWTGYGMSYYYNNDNVDNQQFPPETDVFEDRYSEILRFYPDGRNLLTANGKVSEGTCPAIEISYIGNPANSNDSEYDRMYIVLEDWDVDGDYRGDDAQIDNPDTNAAQVIEWTQWPIELSDFTDVNPDLDLDNIRCIRIGFGKRFNKYNKTPGGEGTVVFDNIRLYGPHCVLSKREDFAQYDFGPPGNPPGDCMIDYEEIAVIGDDWLAEDNIIETNDPCNIGLIAYWPMYEGGGDEVEDVVGDHNGTFSEDGVSWMTPGVMGGSCVHVDGGADSRITIPNWNPLASGEMTIACWVKWAGSNDNDCPQGLVCQRDDWGSSDVLRFTFELDTLCTAGALQMRQYIEADTDVSTTEGVMLPFIHRWAHVAVTYDGDEAVIYFNGQAAGAGPFIPGTDPNSDMTIGNTKTKYVQPGYCPGALNGDIDEVRFYNRALSAGEIAYLADLLTNPEDGELYVEVPSNAELYAEEDEGERIIDLHDFAILADHWLEETSWP